MSPAVNVPAAVAPFAVPAMPAMPAMPEHVHGENGDQKDSPKPVVLQPVHLACSYKPRVRRRELVRALRPSLYIGVMTREPVPILRQVAAVFAGDPRAGRTGWRRVAAITALLRESAWSRQGAT